MKVFTSAAAAIIMIAGLVSIGHGATGLSGADMYAARCESCHGKITETSIIRGATSTMMEFAIKSNFGGMKQLSGISSNDLQSISAAIATSGLASESSSGTSSTPYIPSSRVYTSSGAAQAAQAQSVPEKSLPAMAPVAPSAPTVPATAAAAGSGASLYASYCSGCHGAAAISSKKGAGASRIQAAIKGNAGGMGSLSSLSATDLQAIADALGGDAAVAAIASNNVPAMEPATPAVSSPAASAPASFNAAPDGASLYASNCAFCHGPITSSSKRGASFPRIQTAISLNSGGMGSLATMQASDMMAIVSALNTGGMTVSAPTMASAAAPAGGGSGGSSLYDSSCASCHGPLASSSKKGAAASAIQGAISANTGGMGRLSSLSAADVQSIADALAGGGAGGSGGGSNSCLTCHPNGMNGKMGGGKSEGKRDSSKGGKKRGGGRSEGRSEGDD